MARAAVAGALALLAAACFPDRPEETAWPEPWARSEGVPFTDSPFLHLTSRDRACTIDSYESQVACGGPEWDEVRFGRQGHGPGEYTGLTGLDSFAPDRLALVDFGNRRVTLLAAGGTVGETIGFDGYPTVIRTAVDSTVLIAEATVDQWIPAAQGERRTSRVGRVRPGSDRLVWDTILLPETVSRGRPALVAGAWSPTYGYVFLEKPYGLVRFSPSAEFLGVLTPGHFRPELPSDRDVEARIRDLTTLFGRPPDPESIRQWREQPGGGIIDISQVTFSEDDLLWVGTTRDRTDWSYIDVYAEGGALYLGAFRVRDRLLAFDVRDGTLAALVEEKDRRGVPANRIDWYDIRRWVETVTAP